MSIRVTAIESLDSLVTAFDPRDPAFRSNPYPTYHALRGRSPLHYRRDRNDWIITRYNEVAALAKDLRLRGNPSMGLGANAMVAGAPTAISRFLRFRQESHALNALWLGNRNPPEHTRLRNLLHRTLAPGCVASMRARIEALANGHLDRVEARGGMDIIGDLSRPLSFTVIADVLGIPEETRPVLERLSADATLGVDLDPPFAARERGRLGMIGLTQQFRRLIAAWQRHPRTQESLIGVLLQAHAAGHLSADEVLAQCSLTLIAGHSTTQHLIGTGMLALLRHPDQMRLLRQQPALLDRAVEELMRYDTPAQALERVAAADVEIAGQTIRTGQRVHLVLGAANRDPAIFADSDRLNIARDPNPHLSFGYGIHYCLGAALAKLTTQVAIGTLLRRQPHMSLRSATLEWGDNYLMHGLKSLPVGFA